MSDLGTEATIGYCGYLCSACPGVGDGCPGCKAGGGDADCQQKACCTSRDLQGCWECRQFPCSKGTFGTEAWRGLSLGCSASVKRLGPSLFAERVLARMGERLDFEQFRRKSADEVARLLCD